MQMRASLSLGYSGLSRLQLSKIHLRKLLVSIKSTKFYIKHYELIITKFEMRNRISSCALCCSSEKYYGRCNSSKRHVQSITVVLLAAETLKH